MNKSKMFLRGLRRESEQAGDMFLTVLLLLVLLNAAVSGVRHVRGLLYRISHQI